jgi:hypothetical protein
LIRSDIIRGREVFYDEVNFSTQADAAACFEVLQEWDFGFVHQVLTYTRRHDEAATGLARKVNSYIVANILFLKKYGPIYLESAEYEQRLKGCLKHYYRFLGKSVFQQQDKPFWEYHKKVLPKLGGSVHSIELYKAIFLELASFLLNPSRILRKLF